MNNTIMIIPTEISDASTTGPTVSVDQSQRLWRKQKKEVSKITVNNPGKIYEFLNKNLSLKINTGQIRGMAINNKTELRIKINILNQKKY